MKLIAKKLIAVQKTCRPREIVWTHSEHKQEAFRDWLRVRRQAVRKLELRELVDLYPGNISMSGAYRAAVAEGLRGSRSNNTRYDRFWNTINWQLPDGALSEIWGVFRGNIRQRRMRLGVCDAAFNGRYDRNDPSFCKEIEREKRRENRFDGPRPC